MHDLWRSRAGRVLTALVAWFCLAQAAYASETVSFPGPDGVTLNAILTKPEGSGPFPAVVALHGCGGLFAKSGKVMKRDADWAARLAAKGFLVLQPDSFGSRGLGSQCRTRARDARASCERPRDADAARLYLQTRPDVKPAKISLLGWSNGGSTVLYAVRPGRKAGTGPDFARAVAFYPGCRVPAERGWHARLPLMMLIGAADDWTPAKPCQDMAAKARAAGEPVTIHVFADAYHDFDHPDQPVHERKGLAFTGNGTGVAHTGTNPAARAAAIALVPDFLAH